MLFSVREAKMRVRESLCRVDFFFYLGWWFVGGGVRCNDRLGELLMTRFRGNNEATHLR